MAGLVPAIHVEPRTRKGVDARDKPGHDGGERARIIHTLGLWAPAFAGATAMLFSVRYRFRSSQTTPSAIIASTSPSE